MSAFERNVGFRAGLGVLPLVVTGGLSAEAGVQVATRDFEVQVLAQAGVLGRFSRHGGGVEAAPVGGFAAALFRASRGLFVGGFGYGGYETNRSSPLLGGGLDLEFKTDPGGTAFQWRLGYIHAFEDPKAGALPGLPIFYFGLGFL